METVVNTIATLGSFDVHMFDPQVIDPVFVIPIIIILLKSSRCTQLAQAGCVLTLPYDLD